MQQITSQEICVVHCGDTATTPATVDISDMRDCLQGGSSKTRHSAQKS